MLSIGLENWLRHKWKLRHERIDGRDVPTDLESSVPRMKLVRNLILVAGCVSRIPFEMNNFGTKNFYKISRGQPSIGSGSATCDEFVLKTDLWTMRTRCVGQMDARQMVRCKPKARRIEGVKRTKRAAILSKRWLDYSQNESRNRTRLWTVRKRILFKKRVLSRQEHRKINQKDRKMKSIRRNGADELLMRRTIWWTSRF